MESTSHLTNVYHIAGLDERKRGFNRQAHLIFTKEGVRARLRYEQFQIEVDPVSTEDMALQRLVGVLQNRGYSQLRTQLVFQGEQYLGTQHIWVEYLDPEVLPRSDPFWRRLIGRFFPFFPNS